jgi:hypothetical protein
MSEIKTVTYEGKVYQIGGIYEFSDSSDYWTIDELLSIKSAVGYPFKVKDCEWSLIREAKSKIGTITPAQIELVDGAAYMFDYEGRKVDRIGIYLKHDNHFVFPIGYIHTTNCTNIRLMTVESK